MVNDFTRIWGRTEKEGYPMIKNKKILIPLLVVIIILLVWSLGVPLLQAILSYLVILL